MNNVVQSAKSFEGEIFTEPTSLEISEMNLWRRSGEITSYRIYTKVSNMKYVIMWKSRIIDSMYTRWKFTEITPVRRLRFQQEWSTRCLVAIPQAYIQITYSHLRQGKLVLNWYSKHVLYVSTKSILMLCLIIHFGIAKGKDMNIDSLINIFIHKILHFRYILCFWLIKKLGKQKIERKYPGKVMIYRYYIS